MHVGYKRITGVVLAVIVAGGLLVSPAAVVQRFGALLDSPYFPLVLLGLYLVRSLIAWPITAVAVLVGFKYGLALGVPIALAGAVVSTYVPYAITRYTEFESNILERAERIADHFFDATGDLRGVVTARIAPVPAQATSVAAGAAPVHTREYLLGTAIGEIPWAVAAVTIGASLHRLTVDSVSFSPWLIVGTVAATAVLLAGPAYTLLRDDHGWQDDEGDSESPGEPA